MYPRCNFESMCFPMGARRKSYSNSSLGSFELRLSSRMMPPLQSKESTPLKAFERPDTQAVQTTAAGALCLDKAFALADRHPSGTVWYTSLRE
jgi:hypothetical protein